MNDLYVKFRKSKYSIVHIFIFCISYIVLDIIFVSYTRSKSKETRSIIGNITIIKKKNLLENLLAYFNIPTYFFLFDEQVRYITFLQYFVFYDNIKRIKTLLESKYSIYSNLKFLFFSRLGKKNKIE